MQDIKELAYLLKEHHLRPVKSVGCPIDKHSKVGAFYEGLIKGKIETDEDALRELYQDTGESARYRKLKSEFRDRLLDALLFLDTSSEDYSDYQKAYYECHKQWLFVKILTGQNANSAALYLATRLMKQAIRFEFVQLCMDISSYLRIQYALREPNDKKYQQANQHFEHYRNVYDAECLAEQLYTMLIAKHINSHAPKADAAQLVEEYHRQVQALMTQYDTYRLHMYGRLIGLMRFMFAAEYEAAGSECDAAIRFFRSKPYEARVPLQIFYYQKMICNIQMRQFAEGQVTAHECLRYLKPGTFNWFKYRELYLKLLFHTGKYTLAGDVILDTLAHPRFQFLPDNVKEIWRIFEAYVQYLSLLGKVDVSGDRQFKISKFLNDTPIYARDKSGLNIAIMAIKILFFTAERKYAQLVDEAESIEQYCYRYLNTPETQRSFNLIKLLLQIPAGKFDLGAIDKRAQRFLDKLQSIPLQVANQTDEVEIIPYETLWQMARESMGAPAKQAESEMGKSNKMVNFVTV